MSRTYCHEWRQAHGEQVSDTDDPQDDEDSESEESEESAEKTLLNTVPNATGLDYGQTMMTMPALAQDHIETE